MKRALFATITVMTGLVLGAASALWATGLWLGTSPLAFSDVDVAGWRSDWNIGAPTADPYLRARIARHGLLALVRTEAVYLTRNNDDDGADIASPTDRGLILIRRLAPSKNAYNQVQQISVRDRCEEM